jgi:hypothetical protein
MLLYCRFATPADDIEINSILMLLWCYSWCRFRYSDADSATPDADSLLLMPIPLLLMPIPLLLMLLLLPIHTPDATTIADSLLLMLLCRFRYSWCYYYCRSATPHAEIDTDVADQNGITTQPHPIQLRPQKYNRY